MITTAFCEETKSLITISQYNPALHLTLLCTNQHPLVAKRGPLLTHHFSHLPNTTCTLTNPNKTEWHLRHQSLYPETEIPFPSGNIADIVIENTVIEIQHSPISQKEISIREQVYNNMIWIFDVRNSVTGTEFICRDEAGFCILKLNRRCLSYSNKLTYYDTGRYLCMKMGIYGKYALCKIVQYTEFAKQFEQLDSETFSILIQDPLFDFAFTIPSLHVPPSQKIFSCLYIAEREL